MNYRHAFHAGNFADLVKHAALLQLLSRFPRGKPLTVIDTHAGGGVYDLSGPEAQRSGEWQAGIGRLAAARDAPKAFEPLLSAVRALNRGEALLRYPGSPWLTARALGRSDRYVACELNPGQHADLRAMLGAQRNAEALCADGFRIAPGRTPAQGEALVLIDPPFERGDDHARIVETAAAVRRRNLNAVVMAWLPLKDLATFDGFLGDLAEATDGEPLLVAETRLRPLVDPMKMNGCALVLTSPPEGLEAALVGVCAWTAAACGEAGEARVYRT